MGKPDAPTPPNPLTTAAAQTSTNVQSAVANAYLNNVNQNTPQGSLQYNATGSYGWTDPTTNQTYQIPTFTSTQSLSQPELDIYNQNAAARYNLAGMANAQSNRVAGLLSTPFTPTAGGPSGGDASNIANVPAAATSFNAGGPIQTSFDTSGFANPNNITSTYGPQDLAGFTNQVQQAMLGQINPQLDIQKRQLQQQLADQGIRYGSDAYNNAFIPFNQQENNAYLQTVTGATGQANTLMGMMGQQAAFQNAAQQQAYTQQQGIGSFANAAQGQQFQQNAAEAAYRNSGLAQQLGQQQDVFNAAQTQRNQYMQEQYAQRNQPLNEISALMSGSQVQSPNWLNSPQSQIPTTDVAGLINNQFNQQLGVYQQQNQNYQTLMGGVLGLGAGALKASDRRIKDVGDKIATVFAADSETGERKPLPIYKYSYKADPLSRPHVGPMAQDVEKIVPEAVSETRSGTKLIHPRMVMGSILGAS
jgi:Chaperone of endosialidase